MDLFLSPAQKRQRFSPWPLAPEVSAREEEPRVDSFQHSAFESALEGQRLVPRRLQGDPGLSPSLQERRWAQAQLTRPGQGFTSGLSYFVDGEQGNPDSVQPVSVGECLVCLAFGCLLPRVLMGP